jgi:hypothetical protein
MRDGARVCARIDCSAYRGSVENYGHSGSELRSPPGRAVVAINAVIQLPNLCLPVYSSEHLQQNLRLNNEFCTDR